MSSSLGHRSHSSHAALRTYSWTRHATNSNENSPLGRQKPTTKNWGATSRREAVLVTPGGVLMWVPTFRGGPEQWPTQLCFCLCEDTDCQPPYACRIVPASSPVPARNSLSSAWPAPGDSRRSSVKPLLTTLCHRVPTLPPNQNSHLPFSALLNHCWNLINSTCSQDWKSWGWRCAPVISLIKNLQPQSSLWLSVL